MTFSRLIFVLILISIAVFAKAAQAHDPGFSTAVVTVSAEEIRAVVTYARGEIDALDNRTPPFFQIGDNRPPETAPEFGEKDDAVFRLVTSRGSDSTVTFSNPLLSLLPPGHRQLLLVRDPEHAMLLRQYLHRGDPTASLDLSKFPELAASSNRFDFLSTGILIGAGLLLLSRFVFRRTPRLKASTLPGR